MGTVTEELPTWARKLLLDARVARLGIVDEELRPRVLPVTYVLHSGALWSAVDDKPKRASQRELARVRFLRNRPQAALTVDHYEEDWSALAWVQALGRVRLLAVEDEPEAVSALAAKYEPYREHPPPGPLLCLDPERYVHWRASDARSPER